MAVEQGEMSVPFFARSQKRLNRVPLYRWWRSAIVGSVDHEAVRDRIIEESGWTPRYAFMVMMSAGIAVLGLLLSSPAVVIGAMLISPLMSPILGLGFSLALFDFAEMRRSLIALAIGSAVGVAFTAFIVMMSPLQAPTPEIIARTRPNLFDLAVALFAALAGCFAVIRGRGDTVVGVAIATALMPPLAVVGYGLATWNLAVLGGALALFVTNFVTIALAAMIMARFWGFGHHLSAQQTWTQTGFLFAAFVVMSVPLGISLSHIATEAVTVSQARSTLTREFGADARVTQLEVQFDSEPLRVNAVVITPRDRTQRTEILQAKLTERLERPVQLRLDQVVLEEGASALDAQQEELRQAGQAVQAETARMTSLSNLLSLATGVSPQRLLIDRERRRATAPAEPLPSATISTYHALERRMAAQFKDWSIEIIPPRGALPVIAFADNVDVLDGEAADAVAETIWAAQRWHVTSLMVPGLRAQASERPGLTERRALAIAQRLQAAGIRPLPAAPNGQRYRLAMPEGN